MRAYTYIIGQRVFGVASIASDVLKITAKRVFAHNIINRICFAAPPVSIIGNMITIILAVMITTKCPLFYFFILGLFIFRRISLTIKHDTDYSPEMQTKKMH